MKGIVSVLEKIIRIHGEADCNRLRQSAFSMKNMDKIMDLINAMLYEVY